MSIVTPVFNQVTHVAEAIESVRAQGYPRVEHIVVDGGSTDGTLEVLRQYPHVTFVARDNPGPAHAVNEGMRRATGDIHCVLKPDDTLLPGALDRVAREVDPARGRHVVMGRCRFVDARGRFVGIEHPSHFEGSRRVLEVWKGNVVAPSALFWTRDMWRTCGPMDVGVTSSWIDYDLLCRFSRKDHVHLVDQALTTYRLRMEPEAEGGPEAGGLEDGIRLSRRYWGSPLTLAYWELAISLALYRFDRVGRGRGYLRWAQESWRRGQVLRALSLALAGTIVAPEVAFYVSVYPRVRDRAIELWRKAARRLGRRGRLSPQTAAYLARTEAWSDGWVGPRLVVTQDTESTVEALTLRGWADTRCVLQPLVLTVRVNERIVGRHRILDVGDFAVRMRLAERLAPGTHTVEVAASAWFVPDQLAGNGDFRPLAWRVAELELAAGPTNP